MPSGADSWSRGLIVVVTGGGVGVRSYVGVVRGGVAVVGGGRGVEGVVDGELGAVVGGGVKWGSFLKR